MISINIFDEPTPRQSVVKPAGAPGKTKVVNTVRAKKPASKGAAVKPTAGNPKKRFGSKLVSFGKKVASWNPVVRSAPVIKKLL